MKNELNSQGLKLLSPVKVGPLELSHRVDVIEPRVMGTETLVEGQAPVASSFLRGIFKGPIIAAGGLGRKGADLAAFGRRFSSNPGLPERFGHGHPLTHHVREAFRGGDERAYIDLPAFAREATAATSSVQ